jgi:hypothetical protein
MAIDSLIDPSDWVVDTTSWAATMTVRKMVAIEHVKM